VSPTAENLGDDLARFLGPVAAAEWRVFLGHLDLYTGFGVFVLLLPAKAAASLCEGALRQHLRGQGRELGVLRYAVPERIADLPGELLLKPGNFSSVGVVWVDLLGAELREDPAWQAATRQALAALNQQRNRLVEQLAVPLVFVGEPWLQNALREVAPDLWTVRIAVERLDEALVGLQNGNLLQPDPVVPEQLAYFKDAAVDSELALELSRKLLSQPEFHRQRIDLMLRAAAGFQNQRRYGLAEAVAAESIGMLNGSQDQGDFMARASLVLSAARAALGRKVEALDPAQRAAGLYRKQACRDPDAFKPALAMSLTNLANCLSELGRREEALKWAREAADLYRTLAYKDPRAFASELAGSLNNLAIRLGQMGHPEEALDPAREAADRFRALAQRNPDDFTPALAMSLNNLSIRLSELGRSAEGLGPALEAARLYRGLARQNPDASGPGLASALSNLAIRLTELGRQAEALEPAQEAADLYRALGRRSPDVFKSGLAMSLNNLANFLTELGRQAEALEPAREAADLYRALARQNPEGFKLDRAGSLTTLGQVQEANGNLEGALASFREGVETLIPAFPGMQSDCESILQSLVGGYLRVLAGMGRLPEFSGAEAFLQPVMSLCVTPDKQVEQGATQITAGAVRTDPGQG
jgi:tetratricopeptide (TPR) repeat protein